MEDNSIGWLFNVGLLVSDLRRQVAPTSDRVEQRRCALTTERLGQPRCDWSSRLGGDQSQAGLPVLIISQKWVG